MVAFCGPTSHYTASTSTAVSVLPIPTGTARPLGPPYPPAKPTSSPTLWSRLTPSPSPRRPPATAVPPSPSRPHPLPPAVCRLPTAVGSGSAASTAGGQASPTTPPSPHRVHNGRVPCAPPLPTPPVLPSWGTTPYPRTTASHPSHTPPWRGRRTAAPGLPDRRGRRGWAPATRAPSVAPPSPSPYPSSCTTTTAVPARPPPA